MSVIKFPAKEKEWTEGWRNKVVFGLILVYVAFFVTFIYQLTKYAGNLMYSVQLEQQIEKLEIQE